MKTDLKVLSLVVLLSLVACNGSFQLPWDTPSPGNLPGNSAQGPANGTSNDALDQGGQPGGNGSADGAGSPSAGGNGQSGGSGGDGGGGGSQAGKGQGMLGGMGGSGGMRARHMAQIPPEYAGLTNPVSVDEASLERGEIIFTQNCAVCHGDGGMGDGPGMPELNPAPAPLAHTSQMLGEDYLFWRISEGGSQPPFNSGMPAWKEVLLEQDRWDVINYVKALGSGRVQPRFGQGGATYDPLLEAQQQAQMLKEAQAQGLITADEATTFELVHKAMDEWIAATGGRRAGQMDQMRDQILESLVQSGLLTQEQIETFLEVHDRLVEAGLMD